MKTKNIEGLTLFEINTLIQKGAKFVTFSKSTRNYKIATVYFIRPGEKTFKYAFQHFLSNLLTSWRLLPLRPGYMTKSLFYLTIGGKSTNEEILAAKNKINSVSYPDLDCLNYI